jgi:hypothetical protein
MSYRKATEKDLNKHISQFFIDDKGTEPVTKQPTKDNITDFYVITTLGDNHIITESSGRGGSRRRRPSRKYKKSAKRVFRKKSRSTRRR